MENIKLSYFTSYYYMAVKSLLENNNLQQKGIKELIHCMYIYIYILNNSFSEYINKPLKLPYN